MITGDLKSKIDRVWDAFWSGGISNPLEVIEQITYLLFLRRLDDLQVLAEKKARIIGGPIQDPPFLPGQAHLRWSHFKNLDADVMFKTVSTQVFPFLQQYGAQVGGDDSTYSEHMKDARFTIPTAALLSKVVDLLADIPMENRDTNGDLYEYMLGKIASAGQNGQFRTPRHIIKLMVDTQRHAADRVDEHAAARHRGPRHPLPRLALRGRRSGCREVHAHPGQPPLRRIARLRSHQQGPAASREDEEDRATLPGRSSSSCSRPVDEPRSSSPTGSSSAPQVRTGNCAESSSRTRSSTPC